MLNGGSFILTQGRFPCLGVWVSVLMMLSFWVGFGIAFFVAWKKLSRLDLMVSHVQIRKEALKKQIDDFIILCEQSQNSPPPDNTVIDDVENPRPSPPQEQIPGLTRASSFFGRVSMLKESTSEMVQLSKFHTHYRKMLVGTAVCVALHGLSMPIAAYYMLCDNEGNFGSEEPVLIKPT